MWENLESNLPVCNLDKMSFTFYAQTDFLTKYVCTLSKYVLRYEISCSM